MIHSITGISEINEEELGLLEAVGYVDRRELSKADAEELLGELQQANEMLGLVNELPSEKIVQKWIKAAQQKSVRESSKKRTAKKSSKNDAANKAGNQVKKPAESKKEKSKSTKKDKNKEDEPEKESAAKEGRTPAKAKGSIARKKIEEKATVGIDSPLSFSKSNTATSSDDFTAEEILAMAPVALPISSRALMENQIKPSEIQPGHLLNGSDIELRLRHRQEAHSSSKQERPPAIIEQVGIVQVKRARHSKEKLEIYRSIEEEGKQEEGKQKIKRRKYNTDKESAKNEALSSSTEYKINLLTTARESTNSGRKRESRRYVRGVLHSRRGMVKLGAIIILIMSLLIPLAIASSVLLILLDQLPDTFEWVPKWILVFPILLPVVGVFYFSVCSKIKCQVCAQKIMMPRNCNKNSKAHHIPLLGYIIPTSIQLLLFHWFYCMYCGTSIRVKE